MNTHISSLNPKTCFPYFRSATFSKCQIVALSIFIIISFAIAIGGVGWYLHINSLNSAQISMMVVGGIALVLFSLKIVVTCRIQSKKNLLPKTSSISDAFSTEVKNRILQTPTYKNQHSAKRENYFSKKSTTYLQAKNPLSEDPSLVGSSTVTAHNPSSVSKMENNQILSSELSSMKNEKEDDFFTYLTFQNLYLGCKAFKYGAGPGKGVCKYILDLMLDRRYSSRKDVVIFNKEGKIISQSEGPVTFAYANATSWKGNDNIEKIKKILNGYAEEKQKRPIPKLFIHLCAEMGNGGSAHTCLLVVETDSQNHKERITLINPYGHSKTSYHKTAEAKWLRIAQEVFPSACIVKNSVCQQQDFWSCGWHALENVHLLEQVDDIQELVKQNRLPIRSSNQMKVICEKIYMPLVKPVEHHVMNAFPNQEAMDMFDAELIAKNKM